MALLTTLFSLFNVVLFPGAKASKACLADDNSPNCTNISALSTRISRLLLLCDSGVVLMLLIVRHTIHLLRSDVSTHLVSRFWFLVLKLIVHFFFVCFELTWVGERWEFEGWGPEGWRAQISRFLFPCPATKFVLESRCLPHLLCYDSFTMSLRIHLWAHFFQTLWASSLRGPPFVVPNSSKLAEVKIGQTGKKSWPKS